MCMKIILKQDVTSGTLNIEKYIEFLFFTSVPVVPVVSFRLFRLFRSFRSGCSGGYGGSGGFVSFRCSGVPGFSTCRSCLTLFSLFAEHRTPPRTPLSHLGTQQQNSHVTIPTTIPVGPGSARLSHLKIKVISSVL